ncbi:MAG: ABC transporter permease/substrate-binding protein, partial [Alphaproteobacteria bacterium]
MSELFLQLPDLLAGHLGLALSALALGTLLSVPLGVLAHRLPAFGGPVLGFTGLVQTVPSMALLALMVPLFGGMIGFWPAFAALTLYSMLPTLRNTATGLAGIDPTLREAAQGLGMTNRQSLFRVELPLALPVMMAGLRTASVWVVGTATLATPVGAQSLGGFIFAGLQTRNWGAVIFGCIFAAGLAMAMDVIIAQGEKAAAERSRRRFMLALAGFCALLVAGFGPLALPGAATDVVAIEQRGEAAAFDGPVKVGAKSFTEQFILADLITAHLAAKGIAAEATANMGSTILFDALTQNQVDAYVDYTGTIWATLMKREAPVPRHQMAIEVAHYLHSQHGVLVVGNLGFENAYGFAMRRDQAMAMGVTAISDLQGKAVS